MACSVRAESGGTGTSTFLSVSYCDKMLQTTSGCNSQYELAMQAFQRDVKGVRAVLGEPQEVTVASVPGADKLTDWMNVFRITQASPQPYIPQPWAKARGQRQCISGLYAATRSNTCQGFFIHANPPVPKPSEGPSQQRLSAECILSAHLVRLAERSCALQGREVWEALGDWVTEAKPDLGPGTKERFEMASKLQPDEVNSPRPRVQNV